MARAGGQVVPGEPSDHLADPGDEGRESRPSTEVDPPIDVPQRQPASRPPRRDGVRIQPDLHGYQRLQGQHVGDRYVRVIRQQSEDFQRVGPGHLIAKPDTLAARGPVGRAFGRIKRFVIGAPLTTAAAAHERLTKTTALAVLSSDALSSVAYATEEILRILLIAGVAA